MTNGTEREQPDAERPGAGRGLLRELLARRVPRAAFVYLAGAFAMVEGTDITLGALGGPDWVLRVMVVLVLAGFPIAMAVAWTFDLTRQGLVRTAAEPLAAGAQPRAALRWPALAGVAAISLVVAGWLALRPVSATAPIRAVAVLPLENQMATPGEQHFVDGMHEALIGELAQVPDLTVISRTSTLRWRERDAPLGEIATALGVDALIEGSVYRDGDSVRITVRLMRAAPEVQVWADEYTAAYGGTLQLQRRVAQSIANAVRLELSRAQLDNLPDRDSENLMANEEYVRGLGLWLSRSPEALARAVDHLERAVELDPGFAIAHAALANAYVVARGYGAIELSWDEAHGRAEQAATRALQLNPRLAEGHAAVGFILYQWDWDLAGAELALRRAVELNPNYAQAWAWLSLVLRSRALEDRAVEAAQRARALDPVSAVINRYLAFALAKTRRCDEGQTAARTAIELDPSHPDGYMALWACQVQNAEWEAAVETAEAAFVRWGVDSAWIDAYHRAHLRDGWRGALGLEVEALANPAMPVRSEYMRAQRFALMGELDAAFDALDAAIANKDPLVLFEMKLDPLIDALRPDPRFRERLRTSGLGG